MTVGSGEMDWTVRGKYIVSFTVKIIVVLLIGFYGVGFGGRVVSDK